MRARNLAIALALTVAGSGCVSALRVEQTLPPSLGDLTAAQVVEITDWSGTVLLRGTLSAAEEVKGRIERTAELTSPANTVSRGTVEVEIDRREGTSKEEFRVLVQALPYPASCKLLVDGHQLTMFSTTEEGRVLVKLTRRVVPTTATKQP
jgi:hypothetical protein